MTQQSYDNLFAEFPPSTRDEWVSATIQSLNGKPFEKLIKSTYEGIDLQPMYRAEDVADIDHIHTLPGQFPYVRGTKADAYRSQAWLIAQDINLSDPKAFNEALKHDLEHGQTAIYIGDHLQIDSVDDLETLFADIDLKQYPVFIQADITATAVYNMLAEYVSSDDLLKISGCIGYDPLHKLASSGRVSAKKFDLMAELIPVANDKSPLLDTIAVRTDIYHHGGANAVQEMAIAMATGVTYLSEMLDRGLNVDHVAQKMRFFMAIGENFFMEIAKLRAIKILWAQIVREFGGNDESQKIKLHVGTGLRNKTRLDAHVNMLRVTSEAMAGAIGGADSMTVSPFDVAFGESDEFSRRIARNVQLILQEEVNLVNLIDPAGGSWYVEHLTDQLAQSAWEFFQQIEAKGGMIQALQSGFIQSQIQTIADARIKNLEAGTDVLVGTNKYADETETLPEDRNLSQAITDDLSDDDNKQFEAQPLKPIRFAEPFESQRDSK